MINVVPFPTLESSGAKSAKSRVFVVEDHPFMRRNLVEAIERESTLSVCGQAEDAPEAIIAITSIWPDLVLTDLELKSSSGFDLIKSLNVISPALPVIATTVFDAGINEMRARAAGAAGFVAKQDGPAALIQAIHDLIKARSSTAENRAPFSPKN